MPGSAARRYRTAQRFAANKDRLDLAFYGDLQRVCAMYVEAVQPACYALVWIYYETAQIFGCLNVTPEQIDDAAKLLPAYRTPRPARRRLPDLLISEFLTAEPAGSAVVRLCG